MMTNAKLRMEHLIGNKCLKSQFESTLHDVLTFWIASRYERHEWELLAFSMIRIEKRLHYKRNKLGC